MMGHCEMLEDLRERCTTLEDAVDTLHVLMKDLDSIREFGLSDQVDTLIMNVRDVLNDTERELTDEQRIEDDGNRMEFDSFLY